MVTIIMAEVVVDSGRYDFYRLINKKAILLIKVINME